MAIIKLYLHVSLSLWYRNQYAEMGSEASNINDMKLWEKPSVSYLESSIARLYFELLAIIRSPTAIPFQQQPKYYKKSTFALDNSC